MAVFYNEHDAKTAAWLRELIRKGLIADGIVDERSIEDVSPEDLREFTQCHFFAGVGTWSYALRKAGWDDTRSVWTGSCPCQPFSTAGKGKGFADERHLWPAFFHLIEQCRPNVVFGEQVAGRNGLAWIDLVQTDLENSNYAFGAVIAPACGFGAPHRRERLYWVAHSSRAASRHGATGLLGDADHAGPQGRGLRGTTGRGDDPGERPAGAPGPVNGFWANAEWLPCRDGKARATGPEINPLVVGNARLQQPPGRVSETEGGLWEPFHEPPSSGGGPVESCAEPLVDGLPAGMGPGGDCGPSAAEVLNTTEARVMRLRGYGNGLVSQQAEEFIKAYMSIQEEEEQWM